ncbi:MAG: dihydropteroate synthase [Planctomycetes bacterium]|nr:dihydropteroate synthase [Planctomycetota bacterium]
MAEPSQILLVTGTLAEPSLRRIADQLNRAAGARFEIAVLGIRVAALMNTAWVARHLRVPANVDRVVLPGWCRGELELLEHQFGVPFERGPKDLLDLPEHFGGSPRGAPDVSQYDIEILAEINDAPLLSLDQLGTLAEHYRRSGADVIDLGCVPGQVWREIGTAVTLLRQQGLKVSVDSFEREEVERAVEAGAELVLSCNTQNVQWLKRLGVEVVVVPDGPPSVPAAGGVASGAVEPRSVSRQTPGPAAGPAEQTSLWIQSVRRTIDQLKACGVPFRIDPILEPVGFGFAASLARYFEVRRRWPEAEMLMGVGNLTELTEVDSAGVNCLLAAFCQELRIRSVLTTEVANWARSSVRELDLARRLVRYSMTHRVLPKHVDSRLVMLRDPKLRERSESELRELAARLTDGNFRIFSEGGRLFVMNRDGFWSGHDPEELFRRILADASRPIDAEHAFYLGTELTKAALAARLGKRYVQDEPLAWGFLSQDDADTIDDR